MLLAGFGWFWLVPCFSNYAYKFWKSTVSFEKSNRHILEIKSATSEIKQTNFGNQKCHLRNQTEKFWKSKVSFKKSSGQILKIKSII